jgi:hypothetical protein
MTGSVDYPLSERIRDTIAVHGEDWTAWYYVVKHKVPALQYLLLTYNLNK